MATLTRRRRDNLRGSAENADREKLNDERGIKPLPVNHSRDEAELGKATPGGLRGCFCILTPEISSEIGTGNYGKTGVLHIPRWNGRNVLTDVTAVVKSQTNRARSEVSGVVSGAGQQVSR